MRSRTRPGRHGRLTRSARRGGGCLAEPGRLGRRGRLPRIEAHASRRSPLLVEPERACRAAGEAGYPPPRLAGSNQNVIDWSARRGGGCLAEPGRLGRRGRLPRIEAHASRRSPLLVEPERACRAAGEAGYPPPRLAGSNQNLIDWSARRGGGCLAEPGRLGRRGRLPRIEAHASRRSPLLVEPERACRAAGEAGYPPPRLAGSNQNVIDGSARRGGGCLAETGRLGRRGRLPRIEAHASRTSPLLVEPERACRAAGGARHPPPRLAGAINQNSAMRSRKRPRLRWQPSDGACSGAGWNALRNTRSLPR